MSSYLILVLHLFLFEILGRSIGLFCRHLFQFLTHKYEILKDVLRSSVSKYLFLTCKLFLARLFLHLMKFTGVIKMLIEYRWLVSNESYYFCALHTKVNVYEFFRHLHSRNPFPKGSRALLVVPRFPAAQGKGREASFFQMPKTLI